MSDTSETDKPNAVKLQMVLDKTSMISSSWSICKKIKKSFNNEFCNQKAKSKIKKRYREMCSLLYFFLSKLIDLRIIFLHLSDNY